MGWSSKQTPWCSPNIRHQTRIISFMSGESQGCVGPVMLAQRPCEKFQKPHRLFTKSFRVPRMEGYESTWFSAVLGMGIPLHPYTYSLYDGEYIQLRYLTCVVNYPPWSSIWLSFKKRPKVHRPWWVDRQTFRIIPLLFTFRIIPVIRLVSLGWKHPLKQTFYNTYFSSFSWLLLDVTPLAHVPWSWPTDIIRYHAHLLHHMQVSLRQQRCRLGGGKESVVRFFARSLCQLWWMPTNNDCCQPLAGLHQQDRAPRNVVFTICRFTFMGISWCWLYPGTQLFALSHWDCLKFP